MTKLMYRATIVDVVLVAVFLAGLMLAPQTALSQDEQEQEAQEKIEEYEEALEELEEKLPPVPPLQVAQKIESRGQTPKLGLYLDDLDFEDVYQIHYPENYGVLIESVVRGGSADRAGLRKGDVIMAFDGEKVRYEDHLLRMRDSKNIGDAVSIEFFRDEKLMTTNLTFYPGEELDEEAAEKLGVRRERLSPGYGGGGFEPVMIVYDFTRLNDFLTANGFDEITDDYVVAFGGGGGGNVGKGWFIGGMGAGFEMRQQIAVKDAQQNIIGQKVYRLESGFGGVTITKKHALVTEKLVLDVGVMLGGGGTTLEVSQTDGDFSWEDNIGEKKSYAVRYEKGYFAYLPSVGLLVRITNWFGVHGSVGYLGTYSIDEKWTEKPFDFTVGGTSPGVPSGMTFSIGVWFGH